MTFKTEFWKESAEQLQAKLKKAADTYADAVKSAHSCGSAYQKTRALEDYVAAVKACGFTEADALRWSAQRVRRP